MKPSGIRLPLLSPPLLILLLLTVWTHLSCADVGTAASYGPPYTPTRYYGNDSAQFPSSNLFAAAGEGIWDNGASCGRQYLVNCTSALGSGFCIPNQTIQVQIVDRVLFSSSRPSSDDTTIVLSTTAFDTIAKFASAVNIMYQHQRNLNPTWFNIDKLKHRSEGAYKMHNTKCTFELVNEFAPRRIEKLFGASY